jgi:hypothetical protein
MRVWITIGAVLVGVGCSGGSSGIADGPTDAAVEGGLPVPSPSSDGGDAGAVTSLFKQCTGMTPKPLTAGSQVDAHSGATLHWPAPWTGLAPNQTGGSAGASTPYQYVPTNATAASGATATVTMSPVGVSSDAQGAELLQSAVDGASKNGGDAKRITIGGHDAVIAWRQEAPPQPGCQGCAGDPGPDYVNIEVSVYLGATPEFGGGLAVLEVRGGARTNAVPADVFCDMEQMALGITLAR